MFVLPPGRDTATKGLWQHPIKKVSKVSLWQYSLRVWPFATMPWHNTHTAVHSCKAALLHKIAAEFGYLTKKKLQDIKKYLQKITSQQSAEEGP